MSTCSIYSLTLLLLSERTVTNTHFPEYLLSRNVLPYGGYKCRNHVLSHLYSQIMSLKLNNNKIKSQFRII